MTLREIPLGRILQYLQSGKFVFVLKFILEKDLERQKMCVFYVFVSLRIPFIRLNLHNWKAI